MRWMAPPGWPQPPAGWAPPPDWTPDASWPPAPPDWEWWQEEDGSDPDGQRGKVDKLIAKFGGSPTDEWAVGQLGAGFVRFDGDTVHIQHSGVLSRMTVGKGSKRVPLSAISAIHLKPAGPIISGYMQFTMAGATELRAKFGRQSFDAASDENSIMFTKKEQPYFEALRDSIERAQAAQRRPQQAAAAPPDVADQIRSLAGLRDAGILSEDEFQAKKKDLLSRM